MKLNTAKQKSVTEAPRSLELLVRRLKEDREGALEELIGRTQEACFRLAFSLLKDQELARDALQDSYLVVYQKIGQLRDPGAFKTWLFRIVTHACRDIQRKRSKEVESELQESLLQENDLAEAVSQQDQLRKTFTRLPEIDRTALALREVCSLSYEEMSRVLEVPLGTVRSRLAKARERFIQMYRGGK